MHLCKRHVWICMDMGQHGYSMAMLNPWCPVPSTSHGEPWKYHGALWKPHGVPWRTGSHPWCAIENLWCPMESPWCFMENPRDTMEYFCKGIKIIWSKHSFFPTKNIDQTRQGKKYDTIQVLSTAWLWSVCMLLFGWLLPKMVWGRKNVKEQITWNKWFYCLLFRVSTLWLGWDLHRMPKWSCRYRLHEYCTRRRPTEEPSTVCTRLLWSVWTAVCSIYSKGGRLCLSV